MSAASAQPHGFPVKGYGMYAVVCLRGDLVAAASEPIELAVTHALGYAPNILVNMRQVTYVHPEAWAAIVRSWQRVQPFGTFALYGATRQQENRLREVGLTSLISSFDNLEEALVGLVLHPDPSHERRARILLRYIHRAAVDSFSRRDMFSRVPREVFPTISVFQDALDVLEAAGHVSCLPAQRSSGPGRPRSPRYLVVSPRARQNDEEASGVGDDAPGARGQAGDADSTGGEAGSTGDAGEPAGE